MAWGLVGQQTEQALAAAAVRELCEGRASVLAIEGEAGIGKTRLAHGIADDARSRGVAVFCGQAHPFERTRPFGVVAAALELSRRSPDPRRAAIGELLAGQGCEATRAAGGTRYRVVEEIVDLVESSCAERPVLLVAEDIQWADSASLLAILSVARQLPLAALLIVVTARPSPLPPEVVRLLDDLAAGGARTLRLRPLKSAEVAVLARHTLGASPGPVLTAMLAKAGGNPSWAVAMLRSLAEEGTLRRAGGSVEATTAELPASLSDLVVRRLRHLPASTLELLQVAAVLGDAVSLRDVAAVARRPPAEVVGQLGDAFDASLLDEAGDRVVFRHQLVHDAIYRHMPPSARRLLHRESAVALMAAGADRLDVADHLMLGAERGDEQAVAWLRDIARETSAQSPLTAVQLIRRAAALLPDGHRDAGLVSSELVQALLRAGVAVGRQGRYGEALAHARRAAALAAGSPGLRSLPLHPDLFLGLALFDCDLVGEARAAYREALDGEPGSGSLISQTLASDAQASFAIGEWADAVPGLIAGGQAAQEDGDQLLISQSLAYRTIIATARGDHRAANELAARIAGSLEGDQLSDSAGVLAFAVAGLKAAEGDRQGAYELLLRCWRSDAARENRHHHRALAPDLVRLALALGQRDVAAEVASAVAEGVALAPEVPTVRSLALRCQGLVAGEIEPMIEAVALARRAPLLAGHAGACEDAARLLAQGGQRDEAAVLLAEALGRYERAGADAWAGRVRGQLRALGARPGRPGPRRRPAGGWESLTATERAVSLLVAQGLTNGAVARRLFISPHTVNTHLRHVFAKLSVPNRVALAAVVYHSIE